MADTNTRAAAPCRERAVSRYGGALGTPLATQETARMLGADCWWRRCGRTMQVRAGWGRSRRRRSGSSSGACDKAMRCPTLARRYVQRAIRKGETPRAAACAGFCQRMKSNDKLTFSPQNDGLRIVGRGSSGRSFSSSRTTVLTRPSTDRSRLRTNRGTGELLDSPVLCSHTVEAAAKQGRSTAPLRAIDDPGPPTSVLRRERSRASLSSTRTSPCQASRSSSSSRRCSPCADGWGTILMRSIPTLRLLPSGASASAATSRMNEAMRSNLLLSPRGGAHPGRARAVRVSQRVRGQRVPDRGTTAREEL